MSQAVQQGERRQQARRKTTARISVSGVQPVLPISDATVLNISAQGIAISTRTPIHRGSRLSFRTSPDAPPILAEVLACESLDAELFRVRCRCLLGGFGPEV